MTILDSILTRANENITVFYNYYPNNKDNEDEIDSIRAGQLAVITSKTDMTANNTIIIGVVAESPYAEYMGDRNNPFCQYPQAYDNDGCLYQISQLNPYYPAIQGDNIAIWYQQNSIDVIRAVREHDKDIPLVTVQFSGRPMILETLVNTTSTAYIQAWLPGTTGGEAVVSAIMGEYRFKSAKADQGWPNTLPVDWHSSEQDLHNYPVYWSNGTMPHIANPMFTKGYGLSTAANTTLESS